MEWNVEELIPQKAPFVFIDSVKEFKDGEVCTSFEVKEGATLVSGGKLQEAGLVENIAQTAAALEGCNAKLNNTDVKVGFIGSVKQLEITRAALVGDQLETKLKIVATALGVNIAEGEISCGNELIAKCTINVFLQEEQPEQ